MRVQIDDAKQAAREQATLICERYMNQVRPLLAQAIYGIPCAGFNGPFLIDMIADAIYTASKKAN